MKEPYSRHAPRTESAAFVHPTAVIMGDVTLEEGCTVWPQAVLRGDDGPIRVDACSNLQDGVILHGGVQVGRYVTVGHRAILHGCRVGDRALIGMGSIVLDGAQIDDGAIVAAGAVVAPGTHVPPGSVIMGVPGRVVRAATEAERSQAVPRAREYERLGREYANCPQVIDE